MKGKMFGLVIGSVSLLMIIYGWLAGRIRKFSKPQKIKSPRQKIMSPQQEETVDR